MNDKAISTEAVLPSPVTSTRQPAMAPGPKGRILFGSLPEMRDDPLKLLTESAREYGDVVRIHLVQDVHLLNHPNHVKHVLQDNHLNYVKGFGYSRMEPLVGKGLLTSEGDFWKRQRRLAQPAFHRQRIAGFGTLMAARTQTMLEGWSRRADSGSLDVHTEMMKLTLAIVGDALFSTDLLSEADTAGPALGTALEIIDTRFRSFLVPPKALPTPENRRLYGAINRLDAVVNRLISERRASGVEHEDLLGMFMGIKDADTGETMSDVQLRDEVMTMMLAGHETTANALSWLWYLLSRDPVIERKVHAEVTQVLEGRTPTMADLPRLEYTTRVINEAMRLYPPAWLFGRKALEDDVIGGYRIPAGSSLFLSPYLGHRDPRFWENPEGFDPDRFAPEITALRPKFAFFPFAAGPRMCIGNSFARMELQVIVAMVVQKFRLDLEAGHRVELAPQITLRPKNGVRVTLHPRTH
jgi:cytochrome P450